MKKWRNDILLLGAFLLVGVILLVGIRLTGHKGAYVEVSVAGETVETFPLDQDLEYTIDGIDGGTNDLIIRDGEAWLTEASCPDGLCMNMGKISKNGQSIICLPNQVVIRVVDENAEEDENDLDFITGGKQ